MKKSLLVTIAFGALVMVCSMVLVSCENNDPKPPATEAPANTPEKETDTVQFTNPPVDSPATTATPVKAVAKDSLKKAPATQDKKEVTAVTPENPAIAAKPDTDIETGKQLLAGSDCLTCHKAQEKLVGPAYADVAKKYPDSEANIQLLASKIINGGGGVWGQIPMTPHTTLPSDDAKKMVKYILSLDGK